MTARANVYGWVDRRTDLKDVFLDIRRDVDQAKSRQRLTELYKRAGYLITLTQAPSWQHQLDAQAAKLRQTAEREFATTARQINRRAETIGDEGDYDEKWG
jgi:hypothetical protein